MLDFDRRQRLVKEINLTALIDIVFHLMVFVMVTTTFVVSESMELSLPSGKSPAMASSPLNILRIEIISDGSVRVIIAPRDPREQLPAGTAYDFIDTCGHLQGQMLWRWVRVDDAWDTASGRLPQPQCRVVKLDQLGAL